MLYWITSSGTWHAIFTEFTWRPAETINVTNVSTASLCIIRKLGAWAILVHVQQTCLSWYAKRNRWRIFPTANVPYVTYRLASCNSRGACPASLFFCVLQVSLGLVQLESRDIDLWCRTAIRGNKTPHWGRKRSTAWTISALSHSIIFLQACAKERWHAFDIGFTQLRTICCGQTFSPFHCACTMRNSTYLCDFLLSCNSPL